ncbi:unnamed protein product [Leptidea sinapis]|uniref:Uncharacterized protein n=1 Tax=Leptidea sinapis TaxID=189913 RepID=A0A5E4QQS3_9NEOP|nr:unnamed protein product [Leptidea sinapis]
MFEYSRFFIPTLGRSASTGEIAPSSFDARSRPQQATRWNGSASVRIGVLMSLIFPRLASLALRFVSAFRA